MTLPLPPRPEAFRTVSPLRTTRPGPSPATSPQPSHLSFSPPPLLSSISSLTFPRPRPGCCRGNEIVLEITVGLLARRKHPTTQPLFFSCFHVKCELVFPFTRIDTFSRLFAILQSSTHRSVNLKPLFQAHIVEVCQGPWAVSGMTGESSSPRGSQT